MSKWKTFFKDAWLTEKEFEDWIEKVPGDNTKFNCKWCHSSSSLSNMGVKAPRNHSLGKRHIKNKPQPKQLVTIKSFFCPSAAVSSSNSDLERPGSSSTQLMMGEITQSKVAEVRWMLKAVKNNYSFNSCDGDCALFDTMFPDSDIAKQMAAARTKMSYMLNFGVAPYVKEVLLCKITASEIYAISFDETFNEVLQKTQMDIIVRFFDNGSVKTQYLTSEFLGHSTAEEMLSYLSNAIKDLDPRKMLQLSMDGPSVNWLLYKNVVQERHDGQFPDLLNIGSCSLHILHRAFQCGAEASGWGMKSILSKLFYLFHQTSARRADYTTVTGRKTFPKMFCKVRWVESKPVAERAIDIWPDVEKMLAFWEKKKKHQRPQGKSYEVVLSAVKDPLIVAKFQFFCFMANMVEPFLVKYQSNAPLVPFMYHDISSLLKSLMLLVFKSEVVTSNLSEIKSMDLNDKKIHKRVTDVGCAATNLLTRKQRLDEINELEIFNFRKDCKQFVLKMLEKLSERLIVGSKFVKAASSLNPVSIGRGNVASLNSKFRRLVQDASAKRVITDDIGDKAATEYDQLITSEAQATICKQFNENEERLDNFYFKKLKLQVCYPSLASVIKVVLVMYHGQAEVERSFSVNKDTISTNMSELTIVSRRLVKGHLKTNEITPATFNITKDLLRHVKCANGRYKVFLSAQKKEEEETARKAAKNVINKDISECENKRDNLKNICESLYKDCAKYAAIAEEAADKGDATKMKEMILKQRGVKREAKKLEGEQEDLNETIKSLEIKRKRT